jgi:release factor glutamine methyltransferase
MTLKQVLNHAREVLTAKDIANAALECELLLRHTLKISRVKLYQDLNRELSSNQETTFWQLIQRRLSHEPTAYITRHCEFYDLDFYVDPGVLIPRPESELLVEEVLKYADKCLAGKSTPLLIADVGTGSGAIAITLARQLPRAKIYAIDVSMFALKVAAINCRRHMVENQVQILTGDMLEILPEPVDLIVANLPYIKDNEMEKLIPEIRLFEPRIALAGGKDGLDKIRQLCQQICNRLRLEGYLLLEIGSEQARPITNLLYDQFPSAQIEVIPDLNGIDRVVCLRLTQNSPDAKLSS